MLYIENVSRIRNMRQGMGVTGFLFAVLFLATVTSSFAQGPKGRSFGIGVSLGEPTAVTARFWLSKSNSWDLAIGSSAVGNPHIHADYLWHFNDALDSRVFSLYAGVGGILGLGDKDNGVFIKIKNGKVKDRWYYSDDNDFAIAAKGVFGLNVIPRNTPLDIFLEINPVLGISPGFGFDIQPALGIRYYP